MDIAFGICGFWVLFGKEIAALGAKAGLLILCWVRIDLLDMQIGLERSEVSKKIA